MITENTVYHTFSPEETEAVGKALARRLADNAGVLPPFIALYGDLGVGKTAFVRGFASVLSPGSCVRSPTFSIVNEYRSGTCPVFHFDMYRVDSEDDLFSIGYDDYLTRGGVCLAEWSEKIPEAIPEEHIRVTIRKDNDALPESREIRVEVIRKEEP